MATSSTATPPGAEGEGMQTEQLFQALERFLDNEEVSLQTLERIDEQAREGSALRGLSEEATEEYLNDVRARVAPCFPREVSSGAR